MFRSSLGTSYPRPGWHKRGLGVFFTFCPLETLEHFFFLLKLGTHLLGGASEAPFRVGTVLVFKGGTCFKGVGDLATLGVGPGVRDWRLAGF